MSSIRADPGIGPITGPCGGALLVERLRLRRSVQQRERQDGKDHDDACTEPLYPAAGLLAASSAQIGYNAPMNQYARITPHHLAALSLRRAADVLEQAASDPTIWFFVILDLHRAVYCALVATLSGSAGIGAYPDKLQTEWAAWLEESRDNPNASAPTEEYVLPFKELLSRAESGTPYMTGPPLELTPEQRADLHDLIEYRGNLDHVKPLRWLLRTDGLPRIGVSAAEVFAMLLNFFSHRLEIEELTQVEAALAKFASRKEQT
jgi:hypothetical protein